MATAKKTKSGKWKCQVYVGKDKDGKRLYQQVTAPTKALAEQQALQIKQSQIMPSEDTFSGFIAKEMTTKYNILSPNTIRKYKNMLNVLERKYPKFCSTPLYKVTKDDVQILVNDLSVIYAPKTVRNYYGLISLALNDYNVLNGVILPRKQVSEISIPTEIEVATLIEDVKGSDLEIPIRLASECMMRVGEICALTNADIDFNKKTIRINKGMVLNEHNEWLVKPTPKTDASNRIIPIPNSLIERLKVDATLLSTRKVTERNPHSIYLAYERRLKKLGLPHYRFHDLRHFCASVYHYMGVPMSYVQKYGGWSNMNTLEKIYQHTMRDKENSLYRVVSNYFDATFEV